MKSLLRLLSRLCLAALPGIIVLPAQDDSPLKSEMTAYRVTVDPEGRESLVAADSVEPGQVVQYVLTYTNVSTGALTGLTVQGPVPEEMIYLADSATQPAGIAIEYSIDGGQTFGPAPLKYPRRLDDGSVVEAVATPDMYNRLRWIVPNLAADSTLTFTYRVTVR